MASKVTAKCDIVLPVYNNLSLVTDCIESLLLNTKSTDYRLYIIDDCGDSQTNKYLSEQATAHAHITLHRNPQNIGFVKTCNYGMQLGPAPFIVLINSDVVVSPGWLERLLNCAASDPKIASVNPLTNYASQINLPMPPGANFLGMDEILRKNTTPSYPDVVTGVGFCMLLRRSALEQVGYFDEIYGSGYCEESDLCMRLTTNGFRTVVADNVYVYHKGRASFADRDERYLHNRKTFDSRWDKEYKRQFADFRKADPLRPVREQFQSSQRWDPMPTVWQTARKMLKKWREKQLVGVAREAVRGGFQLLSAKRDIASPDSVAKVSRPGRLRVTYVLYNLVVAGGVLSVIQLVNELILLGIDARIVALYEDPAIYEWTRLYTRPIVYKSYEDLIANFPESDIAVATIWNTAQWVDKLVQNGKAKKSAYFLQDYEPWFLPDDDRALQKQVRDTFGLIQNKIVKSDWLSGMLEKDGYPTRKILLGMDMGRFYPRDVSPDKLSVIAMARPGTPRRGFESTIKALDKVKKEIPETEIILFGDRFLSKQNIPFEYRDEGIVTDQNKLAELYSEADVFLDGSDFQGFGRCGLEAMACGAACVLTGVGGVTEYAKHEENSIVVPPKEPDVFAAAILKLLRDAELRERLVRDGIKTTQRFCHKREARETLRYFQEVMEA